MFRYLASYSSDSSTNDSAHYGPNCGTDRSRDYRPKGTAFRSASRSTQSCSCGCTNGQTGNILANVMGTIRVICSLVLVEYIDDRPWILDVVHRHEDFPVANGVV